MTALSIGKGVTLNSAEELEAMLRQIGATRYHNLHPFHRLLHGGKLNQGQVQAWALNRYYYQSTIPLKDAMVISRFRDRTTRIEWRHRLLADGAVRTEPARGTYFGDAAALQFRQSGNHELFQPPPDPGAA